MKPVCLSVMWEAITPGLLPWKQNNLNCALCNTLTPHQALWFRVRHHLFQNHQTVLRLKNRAGMRREPAYAHRNSASYTNTPGTRPVCMATGPNNHLKHNHKKEVFASFWDSLHPGQVCRQYLNSKTWAHNVSLFDVPRLFFPLLFFNLSFNRAESERQSRYV